MEDWFHIILNFGFVCVLVCLLLFAGCYYRCSATLNYHFICHKVLNDMTFTDSERQIHYLIEAGHILEHTYKRYCTYSTIAWHTTRITFKFCRVLRRRQYTVLMEQLFVYLVRTIDYRQFRLYTGNECREVYYMRECLN